MRDASSADTTKGSRRSWADGRRAFQLLDRPVPVGVVLDLQQAVGRGQGDDDRVDPALVGALDVLRMRAAERQHPGVEVHRHDVSQGLALFGAQPGAARNDLVHPDVREHPGDAELLLLGEDHAGGFFAVAQCRVDQEHLVVRGLEPGFEVGESGGAVIHDLVGLPRAPRHRRRPRPADGRRRYRRPPTGRRHPQRRPRLLRGSCLSGCCRSRRSPRRRGSA